MFAIAALASALSPIPASPRGNPATWVPGEYLQAVTDRDVTTVFDLMIDTNGKPVSCVTTEGSGIVKFDQAVCVALLQNGKFKAALDENGAAAPGVWSDSVHFKPRAAPGEYTRYTPSPADIIVEKPAGEPSSKDVLVQTASIINADGAVALCGVSKPSRSPVLNEKACEEVTGQKTLRSVLDAAGARVRGVRSITVKFVAKASR
jgi:hypothetical protein